MTQPAYPYIAQRGRGLPVMGRYPGWEDFTNPADPTTVRLDRDLPDMRFAAATDCYCWVDSLSTMLNTVNMVAKLNDPNSRYSAANGCVPLFGMALATFDGALDMSQIPSGKYDSYFKAQMDAFFAPAVGQPYPVVWVRPSYESTIGTTPSNWNYWNGKLFGQAWLDAFHAANIYLYTMYKTYQKQKYPNNLWLWGCDTVDLPWTNTAQFQDIKSIYEPLKGYIDFVSCDQYGARPWGDEADGTWAGSNIWANRAAPVSGPSPEGTTQDTFNADDSKVYSPNSPLNNMFQNIFFCDGTGSNPTGGGGTSLFGAGDSLAASNSILGLCFKLAPDPQHPLPFCTAECGFISTSGWGGDGNPGSGLLEVTPAGQSYSVGNARNFLPNLKKLYAMIQDLGIPLGPCAFWLGANATSISGSDPGAGGFADGGMTRQLNDLFGAKAVPLSSADFPPVGTVVPPPPNPNPAPTPAPTPTPGGSVTTFVLPAALTNGVSVPVNATWQILGVVASQKIAAADIRVSHSSGADAYTAPAAISVRADGVTFDVTIPSGANATPHTLKIEDVTHGGVSAPVTYNLVATGGVSVFGTAAPAPAPTQSATTRPIGQQTTGIGYPAVVDLAVAIASLTGVTYNNDPANPSVFVDVASAPGGSSLSADGKVVTVGLLNSVAQPAKAFQLKLADGTLSPLVTYAVVAPAPAPVFTKTTVVLTVTDNHGNVLDTITHVVPYGTVLAVSSNTNS